MTQAFWKPRPIEPTPPDRGWIVRLLQWSMVACGLGWAVYGLFAFAFDDIGIISNAWQSILVIVGSALIVIGAEMNTAPTGVAVFHKVGQGKATRIDYAAFTASLVGSIMSALITFSIRQTLLGGSAWRQVALSWGPLVAGLAVALDYYAAVVELGLLKSDYERDLATWADKMETWYAEEVAWNEEHGITLPVDRSQWRAAKIDDIRALAQSLNGQRGSVTTDNLQEHLDVRRVRLDAADSTIRRWIKEELS